METAMVDKPKNKGGRPKGATTKLTRHLREVIAKSFHEVEQKNYLVQMAYEQPAAYMGLIGKILPKEISLDVSHKIDLGQAMIAAGERLQALELEKSDAPILEAEIVSDDTKEKVSSDD